MLLVGFLGNLFLKGEFRFCTTEIDNDVPLVESLDDAVDDFASPILVIVVNHVSFRFPQTLHDHLFCGLSGDTAEFVRVHFDAQAVPEL